MGRELDAREKELIAAIDKAHDDYLFAKDELGESGLDLVMRRDTIRYYEEQLAEYRGLPVE